jgi:hypothetical protein
MLAGAADCATLLRIGKPCVLVDDQVVAAAIVVADSSEDTTTAKAPSAVARR